MAYNSETVTYSFPLLDDLETGEFRTVSLDISFIVGIRVDHRFRRKAYGEEVRYIRTIIEQDAVTGLSTVAYYYQDGDDDDE